MSRTLLLSALAVGALVMGGPASGAVLTEDRTVEEIPLDAPPQGTWSRLDPDLAWAGHAAIIDSATDRMLVLRQRTDELWSLDLEHPTGWTRIPIPGEHPPTRQGEPLVYDAEHRRWILVRPGSYLTSPAPDTEVWILELDGEIRWRLASRGNGPGFRSHPALVYDARQDRLLLYGGTISLPQSWTLYPFENEPYRFPRDLWECDLGAGATWTQLPLGGSPPAVAPGSAAILDSERNEVVLVGVDATQTAFGTTSVWRLPVGPGGDGTLEWQVWIPYLDLGVSPLGFAVSHDIARGRLYLHGGLEVGYSHDTPTTQRSAVIDMRGGGSGAVRITESVWPPGRYGGAGAYDARRGRHLFLGGWRLAGQRSASRELWALEPEAAEPGRGRWTQVGPGWGAPLVRAGQAVVYDPLRLRALVWGGASGWPCFSYNCIFRIYSDLWSLDLTEPGTAEWASLPVVPQQYGLVGRTLPGVGLDGDRDRLVIFGGDGGYPSRQLYGALESIDLAGSGAWSGSEAPGAMPPARYHHGAVIDPRRRQFLVVGGISGLALHSPELNDAWSLDLAGANGWSPLPLVAESPRPGRILDLVSDVEGDRVLAVAPPAVGTSTPALWELDLASPTNWRALTVGPGAGPTAGARSCFDPVRRRLLLFDPDFSEGGQSPRVVVWALDESNPRAWIRLDTGGSPRLPGTEIDAVVYDAYHDRFVLPQLGAEAEVWSLSFGEPRWPVSLSWLTRLRGHSPRTEPVPVARIVVHGASPRTSPLFPRPVDLASFDPAGIEWRGVTPIPDGHGRPRVDLADVDGDGALDWIVQVRPAPHATGGLVEMRSTSSSGARIAGTLEPVPSSSAPELELAIASAQGEFGAVSRRFAARPLPGGQGELGIEVQAFHAETIHAELFDVRGRRIAASSAEPRGESPSRIHWEGTLDLAPGVYLARVRQGAEVLRLRVLRL